MALPWLGKGTERWRLANKARKTRICPEKESLCWSPVQVRRQTRNRRWWSPLGTDTLTCSILWYYRTPLSPLILLFKIRILEPGITHRTVFISSNIKLRCEEYWTTRKTPISAKIENLPRASNSFESCRDGGRHGFNRSCFRWQYCGSSHSRRRICSVRRVWKLVWSPAEVYSPLSTYWQGCLWRCLVSCALPRLVVFGVHLRCSSELNPTVFLAFFRAYFHSSLAPMVEIGGKKVESRATERCWRD